MAPGNFRIETKQASIDGRLKKVVGDLLDRIDFDMEKEPSPQGAK